MDGRIRWGTEFYERVLRNDKMNEGLQGIRNEIGVKGIGIKRWVNEIMDVAMNWGIW